jgi:hypothetical protein
VYILVVAPASARIGRAPVSGLGNVESGCNARYTVEGVQLRLVPVAVDPSVLADEGRLRNRAAHACFGVIAAATAAYSEPFSLLGGTYGLVDQLRAEQQLTDCDVPLTMLYWTAREGIRFVDNWSVRRRVTAPAITGRWPLLLGDRRLSEAEAMYLQFQEQVDDMVAAEGDLTGVRIGDRFDFLPPFGIVPVSIAGARTGFAEAAFDGRTLPDVGLLDGERLRALLAESFQHEPVAIASGDRVQLYVLFENQLALEQGLVARRTLVFASTSLPYRGTARFGYGRWNLTPYGTGR